jgi:hypothetical protein
MKSSDIYFLIMLSLFLAGAVPAASKKAYHILTVRKQSKHN